MTTKINTTINKRMFALMDFALAKGIVANKSSFAYAIGCTPTLLNNIQREKTVRVFSHLHILKAVKLTKSTCDYVYGLNDTMSSIKPTDKIKPVRIRVTKTVTVE